MVVTKRGWRVFAIFVVALVLLALIAGAALMLKRGAGQQASTSAATGATVSLGTVKWHVNGAFRAQELNGPEGPIKAKGSFIVIDMSLTNTANSKTTIDPAAVAIVDKDKHVWQADKIATASQARVYNGEPILSLFQATLAPKQAARVTAVFPIGAASSGLTLKIAGAKVGAKQDLLISIGF